MKDLSGWVDVTFKIVLALTGIVVGYFFSFQKQQNDDIKLVVDLATSSEKPKRLLGATIAQSYVLQKRIPEELYLSIVSYANSSDDPQFRTVVNVGASASVKANPSLQQGLTKASDSFPIRIYFHIRQATDRDVAGTIQNKIQSSEVPGGNQIIVPGIELVAGTQTKSLLKCFRKSECEKLGTTLVGLFKEYGVPIELSDLSSTFENSTSIRPNHFEVWFAPGLKP